MTQESSETRQNFSPSSASGEPLQPSPLPTELVAYLRYQDYAAVTQASDQGTVLIVKATSQDIASARGPVPIQLRHELYAFPTAPVIRMVISIYDQPARPLRLETFINVEDAQQRADYAGLSEQDYLLMLFYDETHIHRLTKQIDVLDRPRIADILLQADHLFQAIPERQFNFEVAKEWVLGKTTL
jgi:hypothetical protein